jgi:hypothetical protein
MSLETHDDNCPGCRPVMVNAKTGEMVAADSPVMAVIDRVWDATNLLERQAWHRVTCQNSRLVSDLRIVEAISQRMASAIRDSSLL